MQILVVVAIIQLRSLKTEVEKGSTSTLIGCRLAGPKHEVIADYSRSVYSGRPRERESG